MKVVDRGITLSSPDFLVSDLPAIELRTKLEMGDSLSLVLPQWKASELDLPVFTNAENVEDMIVNFYPKTKEVF